MRKTITLLLAASLVLSACATIRDSRVNPLNWFGQSRSERVERPESTNPLIPRRGGLFSRDNREEVYDGRPFEQVTDLTVERVPGGAILRATGNDFLRAMEGVVITALLNSIRLTNKDPRENAASIPLHRAITEAVQQRDGAAAEQRMENHLVDTWQRLESYVSDS